MEFPRSEPLETLPGSHRSHPTRPVYSRRGVPPRVLVCACAMVAALALCPGSFAQTGHPNAWQTGVDIAGFEGDMYSALNLSGEQAQQFGRFFSSALYGLSVGDAYVQYSQGDSAGAIGTLSKATAEFAVGLSPWGAAYAGLKLITWAPPAYVDCLVEFNTGKGFEAYRNLRTHPASPWGLPAEPLDFDSEHYRNWRDHSVHARPLRPPGPRRGPRAALLPCATSTNSTPSRNAAFRRRAVCPARECPFSSCPLVLTRM